MSKTIRVVGVDPSMSNFGLAIGTLDLETDKLDIHGLTLVETKAGGNQSWWQQEDGSRKQRRSTPR
ncbi:hypothetical protein CH56_4261 (plasmid) [Yersinia pestis Angola]|nr:hypothetical protein CH56_4261 [Yersinia pestis Angola]